MPDENNIRIETNNYTFPLKKIIFACILPVFALPFYRLTNHHLVIPSTILACLLSLAFLFSITKKNADNFRAYYSKNKRLFLILLIWSIYLLINSIVGLFPIHSIYRLFSRFFIAIPMALLLGYFLQNSRFQKYFLIMLVSTLLFICVILIVEGAFFAEYFSELRINVLEITIKYKNQATWFQVNPNDAGYFISALMLLCSLVILDLRNNYLYLFVLIVPLVACALLFVNSRNSYVAFILVVIFIVINLINLAISIFQLSNVKRLYIWISCVFIFLISIFLSDWILPKRLLDSVKHLKGIFETIGSDSFSSDTLFKQMLVIDKNRPKIWVEAVKIFKTQPITGIGYQTFHKLKPLMQASWHTHNYLLGILVEQGIIGFTLYLTQAILIFNGIKEKYIKYSVIIFPLMMLFDDLSWSYSMPIVLFFLYAIYFSKFSLKVGEEAPHPPRRGA